MQKIWGPLAKKLTQFKQFLLSQLNLIEILDSGKITVFTDSGGNFELGITGTIFEPKTYWQINSNIFGAHHCLDPYRYFWAPSSLIPTQDKISPKIIGLKLFCWVLKFCVCLYWYTSWTNVICTLMFDKGFLTRPNDSSSSNSLD